MSVMKVQKFSSAFKVNTTLYVDILVNNILKLPVSYCVYESSGDLCHIPETFLRLTSYLKSYKDIPMAIVTS